MTPSIIVDREDGESYVNFVMTSVKVFPHPPKNYSLKKLDSTKGREKLALFFPSLTLPTYFPGCQHSRIAPAVPQQRTHRHSQLFNISSLLGRRQQFSVSHLHKRFSEQGIRKQSNLAEPSHWPWELSHSMESNCALDTITQGPSEGAVREQSLWRPNVPFHFILINQMYLRYGLFNTDKEGYSSIMSKRKRLKE